MTNRLQEQKHLTGRPNGSVLRVVVIGLMATFGTAALPGLFGVRINTTASVPLGIYVITSDGHAPMVEFCPAGGAAKISLGRGYRPSGVCADGGAPLLKPVVARAGDTVVLSDKGLQVNGTLLPNTAPQRADTLGRPLTSWQAGSYLVAPGAIWVASIHESNSFDSRYFGPIGLNTIRHRLRPLWVFGDLAPR